MDPSGPHGSPHRELAALVNLGLSARQAELYAALIEGPKSAPRLARDLHAQTAEATRTARDLVRRGLLRRLPGRSTRYALIAPELSLFRLLREREAVTDECRRVVDELSKRVQHGIASPGKEYVEVVVGLDAVLNQLYEQLALAESGVLTFVKEPILSRENPGARQSLARGIENRALWERSLLEIPGMLDDAHRWAGSGETIRVIPSLPSKLVLIDRKVALINVSETSEDETVVAGLLTRHPEVVGTLLRLFEVLWEQGIPVLELGHGAADAGDERDRDEGVLLEYLAAGHKDSAIARLLGVSERTLARRINALMSRLGVETRFQAGLQIGAERGRGSVPEDGTGPGEGLPDRPPQSSIGTEAASQTEPRHVRAQTS